MTMTTLASVSAPGRGATDRLLADVVSKLQVQGVRVIGALCARPWNGDAGHCDSDLLLLPDGPVVRITQDLGSGSVSCRMDAGALEEAVGRVSRRLEAEGADLVVLNKFGLSEAEGRGFRTLIAQALSRGVPVLNGLSDTHRAAFEDFAEGMARSLEPDEAAVLDWCRSVTTCQSTQAEEA